MFGPEKKFSKEKHNVQIFYLASSSLLQNGPAVQNGHIFKREQRKYIQ